MQKERKIWGLEHLSDGYSECLLEKQKERRGGDLEHLSDSYSECQLVSILNDLGHGPLYIPRYIGHLG